jgi:hypothetical protein
MLPRTTNHITLSYSKLNVINFSVAQNSTPKKQDECDKSKNATRKKQTLAIVWRKYPKETNPHQKTET